MTEVPATMHGFQSKHMELNRYLLFGGKLKGGVCLYTSKVRFLIFILAPASSAGGESMYKQGLSKLRVVRSFLVVASI